MTHDWNSVELLTGELASLESAGMPLPEGLRFTAQCARRPKFRQTLDDAAAACEMGIPLSDCLARSGKFPGLFISLVRAGEAGGNMSGALRGMGGFLEKRRRVAAAFRAATIYPAIVLTIAFVTSMFLTFWLVPRYLDQIARLKMLLPASSPVFPQSVLLSFTVQHIGVLFFGALWIVAALVLLLGFISPAREFYHDLLLRLPLYGPLFRHYLVYHFSGVMSLLLAERVPAPEVLDNLAALDDSPLLTDAAAKCRAALEKGQPLSKGLEQTAWFPRSELWLMRGAEKRENLESYLASLAARSSDAIGRGENLFKHLEPTFITSLGLLVGMYVAAVFLPMSHCFSYIALGGE